MNKLFSIITATRNPGASLLVTARSLVLQTFKRYEWIIVDSSSEACSKSLVCEIASSFDALLLSGVDSSLATAWNVGIRASTSPYILLLNSGDSYSPSYLELCSCYVSPNHILSGQPVVVSRRKKELYLFKSEPKKLWRGMHLAHNWLCVPRSLYLPSNTFLDIALALDYEWVLRTIAEFNVKIVSLPVLCYSHGRYTLGGISDTHYFESLLASLRISLHYKKMSLPLAPLIFLGYAVKHLHARLKCKLSFL